jgi:hypothetical protein
VACSHSGPSGIVATRNRSIRNRSIHQTSRDILLLKLIFVPWGQVAQTCPQLLTGLCGGFRRNQMKRPRRSIPYAYTPIPNRFIEEWLANLGHAELRVYLAIMRLTWGFGRTKDVLSIAQIAKTGRMSRSGVDRALHNLRDAGLLAMAGPHKRAKTCEILFPRNIKIGNVTAMTLPAHSVTSGLTLP